MEKLMNLSNLILCVNFEQKDKAVAVDNLNSMKKLRELRKKKSASVFNDNEFALNLF